MKDDKPGKLPTQIDALRQRNRTMLGEDQHVKTAVLLPLIETGDNEWAVLFEKRAMTLRRQAGEICFPGGHCDPEDENERATAIRETCEELGLTDNHVEYIADLDVLVTWSRLMVFPFVGRIWRPEDIRPSPTEVDEVFTVPVNTLLSLKPEIHTVSLQPRPSADFPYHFLPGGQHYAWREAKVNQIFYDIDGRVIWGMTARILTHFLDLIRNR